MMFCTNCGGRLEQKNEGSSSFQRNASDNQIKPKPKFSKIVIIVVAALAVGGYAVKKTIEDRKAQIEANKLLAFATYKKIGDFGEYGAEDLALVSQDIKDEDGKSRTHYGFINKRFELYIPCIFQRIEPFEGNVTIVELENKYALMNKKGEFDQLKYSDIGDFSKYGCARAHVYTKEKGDEYWLIDRKGKELTKMYESINDDWDEESFKCPVIRICEQGKYGYLDNNFHEVVTCKYDDLPGYHNKWWVGDREGFYVTEVKRNGKYGYMDKNFKEVIECKYDYLAVLISSKDKVRIKAEMDDKGYCLIDDHDHELSSWYKDMNSFDYQRCEVKDNHNKYGFINEDGKLVISCIYNDVYSFNSNGECCVKNNGRWFYIDKWGNYLRDW